MAGKTLSTAPETRRGGDSRQVLMGRRRRETGWRWRARGGSGKAGEMNGLGRTDGQGQDGWMAAEVCLLAGPRPLLPRESNGGWHIRELLERLTEMI